ncbi:hypothetical protein L1987_71076 [Smallanthus sonchifolius]|uniref:Uncharacterized protein n=1 Tax=Smallanthus sonchifolius TaxID=185202 RepID=A0ACB9AT09_9ASTR|nr:hypothetical protein L1987_71076 [Smallanthus sonchifolius]
MFRICLGPFQCPWWLSLGPTSLGKGIRKETTLASSASKKWKTGKESPEREIGQMQVTFNPGRSAFQDAVANDVSSPSMEKMKDGNGMHRNPCGGWEEDWGGSYRLINHLEYGFRKNRGIQFCLHICGAFF